MSDNPDLGRAPEESPDAFRQFVTQLSQSLPAPLVQICARLFRSRIAQWTLCYLGFVVIPVQHIIELASQAYEWGPVVTRLSMSLLLSLTAPLISVARHGRQTSWMRATSWGVLAFAFVFTGGTLIGYAAKKLEPPPALAAAKTGPSVAVLPFDNISPDPEQKYFSDGVTEEITTTLAKIPALKVVARTSVFQYRTDNKSTQDIGKALNATHLIEGSVRKDGSQLRIAVRLVKAAEGTLVWSEDYNKELTDIFAVQEQIAVSVAGKLRVPLGLEKERLVQYRLTDDALYQEYLKARGLVRARSTREPDGPLSQAATLLEDVVARDSNYVPARSLLAQVYGLIAAYEAVYFTGPPEKLHSDLDKLVSNSERQAEEAVTRDRDSAVALSALASVRFFRGKLKDAAELYQKALALDPDSPELLHFYSLLLGNAGQTKKALEFRERLTALDPLAIVYNAFTANFYWLNSNDEDAIATFQRLPAQHPFVARQIAFLYESEKNNQQAIDALKQALPGPGEENNPIFYDPEVVQRAITYMTDLESGAVENTHAGLLLFTPLYAFSNRPERALEVFESNFDAKFWTAWEAPQFWHPSFSALRQTSEFKNLMRKAGFVEFWKEFGWPDLCHPVGSDFACD